MSRGGEYKVRTYTGLIGDAPGRRLRRYYREGDVDPVRRASINYLLPNGGRVGANPIALTAAGRSSIQISSLRTASFGE